MKAYIAFPLAFLFFSPLIRADTIIVQEDEQVHPGGTNKATVTMKLKGQKSRMDRGFPPISNIRDLASDETIVLFHPQKTYRKVSASQQKESLETVVNSLKQSGKIPAERPKIRATGRKDTINGWKAEEYVSETKSMKSTYWIANELKSLNQQFQTAMADPMLEQINRQFPDPKTFPGFPVLTILEFETPMGKVKSTTKLVSIKEANIPDADFTIPNPAEPEPNRGSELG